MPSNDHATKLRELADYLRKDIANDAEYCGDDPEPVRRIAALLESLVPVAESLESCERHHLEYRVAVHEAEAFLKALGELK